MATHTLRLTDEQLNVINAGLQEIALKFAGPLIAEINRQLAEEAGSMAPTKRKGSGSSGMGRIVKDTQPTVLDKAEAYLPGATEEPQQAEDPTYLDRLLASGQVTNAQAG